MRRLGSPFICITTLVLASPAGAQQLGYDQHFFLRSEDGEAELTIGGLFQFGANAFDGARDPSTDFDVRRMRLEFGVRAPGGFLAHLEPNFVPDDFEMEEAWVGFDMRDGDARAMFGRMKAPFGLEEVRSRRGIDFARFSILNQFSPAEDHGVFVNGRSRDRAWEYGCAVYNGTGDADTNSSKDVAARAMWHPFAPRAESAWTNLQFGVAGTTGRQDEDVGGDTIDNETGLAVVEFAPGVALDGARTRVGLESAWFHGPWFVQAEYLHAAQEMSLAAADERIAIRGGYVSLAHVLTGEARTFGGVAPAQPFDFRAWTGRGAWVVAARYSDLALDSDLANAALALPGTFTDRIRTYSLALNWIASRHVTLRHALVHTDYADEVDLGDGSDDDEDAFLIELQLSF
ncbi:MAG: OprO/OprP family phosphate-selective porin [Planctomycetota bacterium]